MRDLEDRAIQQFLLFALASYLTPPKNKFKQDFDSVVELNGLAKITQLVNEWKNFSMVMRRLCLILHVILGGTTRFKKETEISVTVHDFEILSCFLLFPSTYFISLTMSGKTSFEQRIEKDPATSELNDQVEFADPPHLSAEDERKLWRKIDLRLLPILSIMYLLSYLDRGMHGTCFKTYILIYFKVTSEMRGCRD